MDNLLNKIITKNFSNLEKEGPSGEGSLQNTKLSGLKKKQPQPHHNQHREQRKNSESFRRERTGHV
jgi:hypothetical protein